MTFYVFTSRNKLRFPHSAYSNNFPIHTAQIHRSVTQFKQAEQRKIKHSLLDNSNALIPNLTVNIWHYVTVLCFVLYFEPKQLVCSLFHLLS